MGTAPLRLKVCPETRHTRPDLCRCYFDRPKCVTFMRATVCSCFVAYYKSSLCTLCSHICIGRARVFKYANLLSSEHPCITFFHDYIFINVYTICDECRHFKILVSRTHFVSGFVNCEPNYSHLSIRKAAP